MRFSAIAASAVVVFVWAPVPRAAAIPQQLPESTEIRSLLREASGLIPKIDTVQQPSVAANIASQQARSGDLDGALGTVNVLEPQQDRIRAMGSVAFAVAWQGTVSLALDLIRKSGEGNDHAKAYEYSLLAEQLATRHVFDAALNVAHLIQASPSFFGQNNLLVNTLTHIHLRQWEADDRAGCGTNA